MKKITILGAGIVGSAIAYDLSTSYKIKAADIDEKKLSILKKMKNVSLQRADLTNPKNLYELIKDADLVIGAVPGFIGFKILKDVINAGKNIVDVSFFKEDPFELDKLAKKKNITAVVDCGISPGFSNIVLGYHDKKMTIENYECFVGGLPFKRTVPFQYKAPFSPIDVIEEYIRPARFVKNGQIIIKDALSDREFIEVESIGTLEAFNTDGLRSLLKTMKIKNMIEKTLRYPGHIDNILLLHDSGFFSKELIEVKGKKIRPLDLTAKLLFPKWLLEKDEEEFTVLRLKIVGRENGIKKEYEYNLFDRYDKKTGISSMARSTGFTCAAVARLIMEGEFNEKGIIPPEYIGANEKCYKIITENLAKHKVVFTSVEKKL